MKWIEFGMRLKRKKVDSLQKKIAGEINELKEGLQELKINYNNLIIKRFQRYLEILYAYQRRLHLISHNDYNYIARRHFLVSLMAYEYIKPDDCVCDVGTGAGFPSIPLCIVKPEIRMILFESQQKKAEYLKYLIAQLQLKNTQIINERAEQYRGERFNVILLKAVGKIKALVKTIDRLINADGCAIFYKSQDITKELKAAEPVLTKKALRVSVHKVLTPIGHLPLALVVLQKKVIKGTSTYS